MKITLPIKIKGYKQDADYKTIKLNDTVFGEDYEDFKAELRHVGGLGLILTPERKVMSWDKCDGNVLVHSTRMEGVWYLDKTDDPFSIFDGRQPRPLVDKCPVDPDACYVLVMFKGGTTSERRASQINWAEVVWFQVLRLVEGYDYE